MIIRRIMLVGAAFFVAAVHARACRPADFDRRRALQRAVVSGKLSRSCRRSRRRPQGRQALCDHVGAQRLPLLQGDAFREFRAAAIADYVKTNFEVLQLNIIGSRKVTDFDGAELSEKELAAKYGVRFTPTFQFFAGRADAPQELAAGKARSGALARLHAAR